MVNVIERFVGIEGFQANAAVVDAEGTILAVNAAWKEFGRRNGLATPKFGVGSSYLQFCNSADDPSILLRDEITHLLAGRLDLLTHVYPCHAPDQRRWFLLLGVPLSRDKAEGAALLHLDVTSLLPPQAIDAMKLRDLRGSMLASIASVVQDSVRQSVMSMLQSGIPPRAEAAMQSISARPDALLTRRQRDVFALLGEGKTNMEIAAELAVSPNTVKLHVSAILRRLDLDSRTQAALMAAKLVR